MTDHGEGKMRIGMMADVYKPHISGITNYIALNKKMLEEMGHEVFIITFGDENFVDDEENVFRSPGLPLVDTGYYLSLSYKKPIRRLLYSMDVVHVHHPFVSGSLALRYCRPRGIPVAFTNHTRYDLYAQAYLPLLPNGVTETMLQAFLPPFCRACDRVIAPSEGLRQVLIRLGVDASIQVLPNGIHLEPFLTPPAVRDRSEFGFNSQDIVLIYVGRLGPEKNLSFLLHSFAGLSQAYDHVKLLLVGDGPERDNLKNQVKEAGLLSRVYLTGLVPYIDLPGYLAIADAFVTASVTEVHPLSLIEAMAAGLPILGIWSPGVGDIIENNVTGYLVTEDIAAFTAKMARLVTDSEARYAMGKQARQVCKKYDINRTILSTLEVYQAMICEASGHKNGWRTKVNYFFDQFRS